MRRHKRTLPKNSKSPVNGLISISMKWKCYSTRTGSPHLIAQASSAFLIASIGMFVLLSISANKWFAYIKNYSKNLFRTNIIFSLWISSVFEKFRSCLWIAILRWECSAWFCCFTSSLNLNRKLQIHKLLGSGIGLVARATDAPLSALLLDDRTVLLKFIRLVDSCNSTTLGKPIALWYKTYSE